MVLKSPSSTSAAPVSFVVSPHSHLTAVGSFKLTLASVVTRLSSVNNGTVMNLVATHSNCTSPMDYISHHALHSHIPVHHYTHHTAVTIHSLVLIVSPHLHLIHSHTFKQHSHMHSLRSLVCPGYISERFPLCVYLCTTWTVDSLSWSFAACLTDPACLLVILSVCCLPCPDPLLCLCLRICLIYVALDTTVWYLPVWPPLYINKAADGSQRHWPVLTGTRRHLWFTLLSLSSLPWREKRRDFGRLMCEWESLRVTCH